MEFAKEIALQDLFCLTPFPSIESLFTYAIFTNYRYFYSRWLMLLTVGSIIF